MYSYLLYNDLMKELDVIISRSAIKDLKKLPVEIIDALDFWIKTVKEIGLYEARKISGYHDEPLRGDRVGQRSIRLNKAYRAFYTIDENNKITITVIEINKHKY
jgi:proteic killer suppression protein